APLWHCRELVVLWLAENNLAKLNLVPLWHATNLKALNITQNNLSRLDISPILKGQKDFKFFVDKDVLLVAEERLKPLLWKKTPASFQKRIKSISWYGTAIPIEVEEAELPASPPIKETKVETRPISLETLGKDFIIHLMNQGLVISIIAEEGITYQITKEGEAALRKFGIDPTNSASEK
ncbi:MAG: hypothetical protein Q6364_03435, partial [Candidatus Hermodarchaeota archaeon]|nr:hypothetical protein [Candidatus Hermodarchaeota archaeon]